MYHLYLFIIFVLHSLSFSVLKLISFHLSETETGRWNSAPQDRCHQARKGQHHQDLNKLDNGHLESHAMICGLLHPGPPSLQKSKEGSFALMYTYSIIVSNIIQHQSQSTVCLTLIRSLLSPVFLISNSATLSPATGNSACFKLLTIELGHPNISLEVKTRQGYRIISGYVCSVLYGLYNVSHTLEPRLSHVPTWPDHQPSAQRPGRPKTTVPKIWLKKKKKKKDGCVWLSDSAWTDDIGWVCKDASKGSPQEPFVKYQTCVQRTLYELFKRSNSSFTRLEL